MAGTKMVLVVGGGAVGLRTASGLAEEGWETTVIEEHPEIGVPVQCGGLISKSGVNEHNLNVLGTVLNEVRGAKIFSPYGNELVVKRDCPVAYVIDRAKFDQKLALEAKRKGVEIRTDTKLIDLRKETAFIKSGERGEMIKAKVFVGADGVNSSVRKILGQEIGRENFVHAVQVKARGRFDKDFVELHFGKEFEGFFAWVIPESGSTARIGWGVRAGLNAMQAMNSFLEKRNIEVLEKSSALIPVGKPLDNVVQGNVLLVGDAAFQTKATTGGGIITGSIAAVEAAKTLSNHFKNKASLNDYRKNLAPLYKELEMHFKLRKFLNDLNEKQLDDLFIKLKNAGVEEYLSRYGDMDKPSRFMSKILWNPKNWSLLPTGLRMLAK